MFPKKRRITLARGSLHLNLTGQVVHGPGRQFSPSKRLIYSLKDSKHTSRSLQHQQITITVTQNTYLNQTCTQQKYNFARCAWDCTQRTRQGFTTTTPHHHTTTALFFHASRREIRIKYRPRQLFHTHNSPARESYRYCKLCDTPRKHPFGRPGVGHGV